ncbi:MAG: hypothetical protein Q9166_002535 [cf. Caloplaca sp. 2 TL-2023]
MALVAGLQAPTSTVMGHAGAFIRYGRECADVKLAALKDAGVVVTSHPSKFGGRLKQLLYGQQPPPISKSASTTPGGPLEIRKMRPSNPRRTQKCQVHTTPKRPVIVTSPFYHQPRRSGHWLTADQSKDCLRAHLIPPASGHGEPGFYDHCVVINVFIHRKSGQLCILVNDSNGNDKRSDLRGSFETVKLKDLFSPIPPNESFERWLRSLATCRLRTHFTSVDESDSYPRDPTGHLPKLLETFFDEQAFSLTAHFRPYSENNTGFNDYRLYHAWIGVDSLAWEGPKAAFGKSHPQKQKPPGPGLKYPGEGTIGTLGKGNPSALSTRPGVVVSNFLDTGGKATSATAKRSFQLVLSDPRVRVVVVNIFGGLTKCAMIAEGITSAYKELDRLGKEVKRERNKMVVERCEMVGVVVRLRGTGEKEGQKIVSYLQVL